MPDVKSLHYTMTLSGSAETLPALGKVRWMSLQPGGANANPVYLGGPGVSSTDYGTCLPAASGGIPPPPHVIGEFYDGAIAVADFYVIGTASQKLHIHYLPFV
jgi:hypothetical protein